MAYDENKAKEVPSLEAGTQAKGTIISIIDGITSDFVKDEAQKTWKGDLKQPCINITIEVEHEGSKTQFTKLFNYWDKDGETEFKANSNLGKFNRFYKCIPKKDLEVKVMTNTDGFWRILME